MEVRRLVVLRVRFGIDGLEGVMVHVDIFCQFALVCNITYSFHLVLIVAEPGLRLTLYLGTLGS